MTQVAPPPRSARITGIKIARTATKRVRTAYALDPQQAVRRVVAGMSANSAVDLMGVAETLREGWPSRSAFSAYHEVLHGLLAASQQQSVARLVAVQRIEVPGGGSYPLKRTHIVTINFDRGWVIAEIRELNQAIDLHGVGADSESALGDLASRFTRLVEEKVRIPAHEMTTADRTIVAIMNYMIDWDQWKQENQPPQPIWGQIVDQLGNDEVSVKWLVGPGGIRGDMTTLHRSEVHPDLFQLAQGEWFHAVIRALPDRIVWLEAPRKTPDPTDEVARKKSWKSIPVLPADQRDVWPIDKK